MNGLTELAVSGPLLVAVALALAAGAISFASPCCLPLVPLIWYASPWAACASTFFLLLLNPVGNAGISSYRMALTP